jgi:pyruvate dehydrogenase E1 component beta subunit
MPATATDARDLLISACLCDDPVLYIDDRWLYDVTEPETPVVERDLGGEGPAIRKSGRDVTMVASSFSVRLALQAAEELERIGISVEVIDLRVINPLDPDLIIESVRRTGRLIAVDGGWRTCGLGGEIIAIATEHLPLSFWKSPPRRLSLPDAPAPTSKPLEQAYYTKVSDLTAAATAVMSGK